MKVEKKEEIKKEKYPKEKKRIFTLRYMGIALNKFSTSKYA